MSVKAPLRHAAKFHKTPLVDVTIVMPCLNEVVSLPLCIANAKEALTRIASIYGLTGEIVVADNGSDDGSQHLAREQGARVVPVAERGYGAALIGGCEGAQGRFILMGDADGSYDFTDGVAMIGQLLDGADLCMGSRFKGGIAPGAMPWKNRYIGNPVLTGILNLFFRSGVSDAHCGLRAITKKAFHSLRLSGTGMEFASEMVIKASLKKLRIVEVPATLSTDLRDRAPHLRPWRDGWRHLRYLLMLSPTWAFGMPGLVATMLGALIFAMAIAQALIPGSFPAVGNYWVILASAILSAGHLAAMMAIAAQLYGIQQGYRMSGWKTRLLARMASLETMLGLGAAFCSLGMLVLLAVLWLWTARQFGPVYSILPAVVGTTCVTIGLQTMMGGFLLAVLGGNVARFLGATDAGSLKK
ncbi:glycosyltransferase family 2 protein [Rhizorhapis suberifaciens]|uniref:Glycosyltransferase involved in cell wall biosynthesis n=1 Tax=Rhizorhapis suberifaciens TaxID=13656 RepID=A0A840HQ94_9SPHN|nr:glycosyltransferase family 2 protein [Rhizorhapis suberifaciens]MBB4639746.1 glycosyltransferase involved in cell wall biosynthesis [Rhizorhapis suberifaciens]